MVEGHELFWKSKFPLNTMLEAELGSTWVPFRVLGVPYSIFENLG